jgi:hypothetical protein
MPETTIAVQPAGTVVQPAPLALKLSSSADPGAPGTVPSMVVAQAMCLVDDQGRAYQPLTELTGRRILQMLTYLAQVTCNADDTIFAPPNRDDQGTL